MFSPLKVKKKIDLAPSLNFAKSRKENREDRSLWAQEANPLRTAFVEAEDRLQLPFKPERHFHEGPAYRIMLNKSWPIGSVSHIQVFPIVHSSFLGSLG